MRECGVWCCVHFRPSSAKSSAKVCVVGGIGVWRANAQPASPLREHTYTSCIHTRTEDAAVEEGAVDVPDHGANVPRGVAGLIYGEMMLLGE